METPFYATPTQRCLVYDKRSGRVIHVHDFIGADSKSKISTADMAEQALTYAGDSVAKANLATIEATGDLSSADVLYKVDIGSGKVIAQPATQRPDLVADSDAEDVTLDMDGINRGLNTGKTLGILALILALAALLVNWLM